ncbi:putative transporter MamV [Azospirillaceae bacterium]|nr:magnetosome protein MamB [uncultured bacterium]
MVQALCRRCRDQAAWTDLLTALALAIFKTLLGISTGSMALQAHALHSFADFLTKGVTLASVKLSSRPATALFPYGYGKVQFLSANFIGMSLSIGSLTFLWDNLRHINTGHLQPPMPLALLGALISALTAEIMHRYLSCVAIRCNSPAMQAAAADNRGDALSSLAVMAGVFLALLGWSIADHLAAILVSLLVLRVGIRVVRDSIHGLMDGAIPTQILDQVREIAGRHDQILEIIRLRGRRMGETWDIDLVLRIPGTLTAVESHDLAVALRQSILAKLHHAAAIHMTFLPG